MTLHIQLAKNLFNLKDTVITCQVFIQRHMYEQNFFPKSHVFFHDSFTATRIEINAFTASLVTHCIRF